MNIIYYLLVDYTSTANIIIIRSSSTCTALKHVRIVVIRFCRSLTLYNIMYNLEKNSLRDKMNPCHVK